MENKYIYYTLFEKYFEYLKYERKLSQNTYLSYKQNIKSFQNYLTHNKEISLEESNNSNKIISITDNDLRNFFNSLNLSSKSTAHYITVINSFYNYLTNEKIMDYNPCENIKSPKIPKNLPNYLTEEEINNLLNITLLTPYDYRNKAMLELLYASGLRVSELVNLKITDIDLHNALVRVYGKGSKERIVPLNDYAIEALQIYIDNYRPLLLKNKNSEYLFINNASNKISRQGFFKFLKKECQRAGIKKNIYPHIIRHTFATHLLAHGADLRVIQVLLGHEDITTTEIYTHIENSKIKKDYEMYHPRSHK